MDLQPLGMAYFMDVVRGQVGRLCQNWELVSVETVVRYLPIGGGAEGLS